MADFCKACAIEHFGEDTRDLAEITTKEDWEKGLAQVTICEGCGFIQVDPEGNCVSDDCSCEGQKGHGLPWLAAVVIALLVASPVLAQPPGYYNGYGNYGYGYNQPSVIFVPVFPPAYSYSYVPYYSTAKREYRLSANREHARMVRARIENERDMRRLARPIHP